MKTKKWAPWTIAEALTRALTSVLQKFIGVISNTVSQALGAAAIIGLTQALIGLVASLVRKIPLFPTKKKVAGACLFGVFGFMVTVLGFLAFIAGADLGVTILITTLSIIPGGLIDQFIHGEKLGRKQWLAIGLGILAGYSVIGLPSIGEAARLPTWIWLAFGMMLGITINQWITQSIRQINPLVKNFWGGSVQFGLGAVAWLIMSSGNRFDLPTYPIKFLFFAVLIGIINVAMWAFNILSYRYGATIALKKLLMNGIFLSTTMLAGVLIFKEMLTWYKILGVIFYCLALGLWHKKTPAVGGGLVE